MRRAIAAFLGLALAIGATANAQDAVLEQIMARGNPKADVRIPYGEQPQQFGELWLPKRADKVPLVVLVHGGCWLSQLPGLELLDQAAQSLRDRGYAVWSLEYRRLGEDGGGYPGTFLDVGAGADFIRVLAKKYPLDLSRVVAVGHSAGGTLALWLAARQSIPASSALHTKSPVGLSAVVDLSGPGDLAYFAPFSPPVCMPNTVERLVGKGERSTENPFADTSPSELLPLRTRQVLVFGIYDAAVPPFMGKRYQDLAQAKGEHVELITIPDAAHFDVIATWTAAWRTVLDTIDRVMAR